MPIKIPIPSNKGKTSSDSASMAAAQPVVPAEFVLLVDKIAITAHLPASWWAAIQAAFVELKEAGALKAAKASKTYNVVHLIALQNETAHVSFDPKKHYFPDLRIEFNPAKLGPSGMHALRAAIDTLLPFGGWDFLMETGRASRIDIAVDIQGARMHQFHLLPQQVLKTTTYEHGAKLKAIYVGKSKGNQLTVYSKSAKAAARGKPLPGPVIRIERRLKGVGLMSDLPTLKNPLLGFNVVATPPGPPAVENTDKKAYVWNLFLDSVARRTLGPALKLLPPAKMAIYRKHWKGYEQSWWDAGSLWKQWPDVLKSSGLMPVKHWPT